MDSGNDYSSSTLSSPQVTLEMFSSGEGSREVLLLLLPHRTTAAAGGAFQGHKLLLLLRLCSRSIGALMVPAG